MITPQTPVELWREADRKRVWEGNLVDYFIDYEVKDPRAVLGAVEALRATGKHPHLGGIGFMLRVVVPALRHLAQVGPLIRAPRSVNVVDKFNGIHARHNFPDDPVRKIAGAIKSHLYISVALEVFCELAGPPPAQFSGFWIVAEKLEKVLLRRQRTKRHDDLLRVVVARVGGALITSRRPANHIINLGRSK